MRELAAFLRRVDAGAPDLRIATLPPGIRDARMTDDVLMEHAVLHWIYAGDTILHILAVAHRVPGIQAASVFKDLANACENRRRATPLHYAADAIVDRAGYSERDQRQTIDRLVRMGSQLDAMDKNGATPLMRAIRCRSHAAVSALIDHGASVSLPSAATLRTLACMSTGRGFSGLPRARNNQQLIVRLLEQRG